jgi:multiple sugar transport system permease protein
MGLGLRKRQLYFRTFLLLPAVVFCLSVFAFFFSDAIRISMHEFRYGQLGRWVGFANYLYVLKSGVFLKALVNNLIYTAGVVAANFVIGFGMALLVTSRRFVGRLSVRAFICLPMLCIPAACALLWRLLYSGEFGFFTQVSFLLRLDYLSPLNNPGSSLIAVMLADVWAWTPYMFLILVAGLESIPRESYEAATIDGASSWQQLVYITLPLSTYVILIALSLKTVDTFRNFVYVWVLTNGGPGRSSEVLSTLTYRTVFQNFDFGEGTAMGVVSMLAAIPLIFGYLAVMMARAKVRDT